MSMMDVIVIRHARAIDERGAMKDSHRPLTGRGRREASEVGQALRKAGVVLDALVMSPLVRAVQTAELIAQAIGYEAALDVAPELGSGYRPSEVVEEVLVPRAEHTSVAIVGHEPQLSGLLALLLHRGVPSPAKGAAIRLRWSGSLARDGEPARLVWVLRPGLAEPSTHLEDIALKDIV